MKLPKYLSDEEALALIKATKQKHHKLAFTLAYMSGLRISEVVNLKKEDFDFIGRKITVLNGKGGKDRVVPMPKGFPQGYMAYIPLSCSIRALQIAFKRTLAKTGINKPGITFHSLRHSFAVSCLRKGMPANIVQVLLGHSNLATTSIYTQVDNKDALKAYQEVWG